MLLISSKQDILVPFNKIGDKDWDCNAERIIRNILKTWGADIESVNLEKKTEEDLMLLESSQNIKLPPALREWYKLFGVKDFKEGLKAMEMIVPLNELWDLSENHIADEQKQLYNRLIVFCNYFNTGTLFCYDAHTEEIYTFDSRIPSNKINKLCSSADEMIKGALIYNQIELASPESNPLHIESWIKAIIEEEIGEDFYNQWVGFMNVSL